jgi:uncharacterized protein (TIGR02271 family)
MTDPSPPVPHHGGRHRLADRPEVVVHAERLRTGTEVVRTGHVRVRRRLVTEERTVSVPVRREEVDIAAEDLPPEAWTPVPGAALGEEVHEVVLHEERVVVTTEWVPVERVRVVRSVVPGARVVQGEVRREVLEVSEEALRADDPRTAPG